MTTRWLLLVMLFASLLTPRDTAASQCPPFGVKCGSGSTGCQGAIGGYCCCKPYCYMQKNTVVCGCNNFCPAQCAQSCPGKDACDRGMCYHLGAGSTVAGGVAGHNPEGKFKMSREAVQFALGQDYGPLVMIGLGAFTKDFEYPIPNGTWTSAGTVMSTALPDRLQRPTRDLGFKVTWVGTDDHVVGSFVFTGRRSPPPMAIRVNLDGTITADRLDRGAVRAIQKAQESAPCPKTLPEGHPEP
jgi:hypothetical protein